MGSNLVDGDTKIILGGDNKLRVRVQPQTPPPNLQCGSIVDEPELLRECANLMLDYLPASYTLRLFNESGTEWPGGE